MKREVYLRAEGTCEKCHLKLKMNEGDFHHTRDPTVLPRSSSVRFLCPNCHRKYGHRPVTSTRVGLLGTERTTRTKARDVVKLRGKRKTTRRVAIRNYFGEVTGYRTVKIRKKSKKTKPKSKTKPKAKTRKRKRS